MVRRTDGRHVRLSNGRRNRAVGRYASVKMGGTVPWESRLELHDLYRAEVDPNITSFFVQPETLHWQNEGRAKTYTPDRLDYMANGSVRVVEVKDVYDPADDPEYTQKLAEAEKIYAVIGRNFVLRDSAVVRAQPDFAAVEEVQAFRRAVVTIQDLDRVGEVLANGWRPLGEVLAAIGRQRPRATLFAMMVRRFVNIDLTRGLPDSANVSLFPDPTSCGD